MQQPSFVVRSQKLQERLLSLVRQRRAAVFMECLSFAFYVAKQQDAARGRIMNGTAVNNDDEWEVIEGVADPGGVADLEGVAHAGCVSAQQHPVPEVQGAGQLSRSELVLLTGLRPVPSCIPVVDVVREENKSQDRTLR